MNLRRNCRKQPSLLFIRPELTPRCGNRSSYERPKCFILIPKVRVLLCRVTFTNFSTSLCLKKIYFEAFWSFSQSHQQPNFCKIAKFQFRNYFWCPRKSIITLRPRGCPRVKSHVYLFWKISMSKTDAENCMKNPTRSSSYDFLKIRFRL